MRFTPSGLAVATLGVAVNHRTKKNDQFMDEASFFDVVVFGKQAENCADYLTKGRSVLVEGRLRQRRWEKDGQKRSKVEVVADRVQFMGPAKGRAEGETTIDTGGEGLETAPTAPAPVEEQAPPAEEDIPF